MEELLALHSGVEKDLIHSALVLDCCIKALYGPFPFYKIQILKASKNESCGELNT